MTTQLWKLCQHGTPCAHTHAHTQHTHMHTHTCTHTHTHTHTGTRAEVKGRTESDEPEQVEEIFVDEFRAEQQIENEVQSPQMVPSAVKGSEVRSMATEVRSMATEVKQIAAAKQTSNISNVSPPADLRELLNRSKEAGKDTRYVCACVCVCV